MTEQEIVNRRKSAVKWFEGAKIALTEEEKNQIEIADFGLGKIDEVGSQILVYVNTSRYCGKEMLMFPGQIFPEHKHPTRKDGSIGKQETFRCRSGIVYVYVPGEETLSPAVKPPKGDEKYYTSRHEIVLRPGQEYTMVPGTPHWFAGGPDGAIVSEFSSNSDDASDLYSDPRLVSHFSTK
ncbi:MAG: D-lyxose/D-mannose family sugar isomerase [Clostridium sp.]|jgi:D-lyxose ketol-isomerase|uniref:D-lyxose/D-mannose family sugar isomerase n=1 Tax=Clostridium sp. TaxID=1506 RepID=UPI0025BB56B0|nr:D-lyxose/D-mannose family sugar isomerase [Clostridium sp.]MCH3964849.1 D-lyxose/D-mannose family sugar isomerase [Clostridium sp.]MCI1716656.1 D-lyxose/D-mannose family sugar isomerase [Clostridium sp.]MCI1800862.1 D-lyxose/D-mannose family sugar isomerase [Clostridium sp.]MCI1814833.1 D-lyxose/D-mannose family sugar isomerase [Clostridium sp.]MCI1871609.1 D-lyxose/D-mannose family sugar isomerase [Clostridium sp.]